MQVQELPLTNYTNAKGIDEMFGSFCLLKSTRIKNALLHISKGKCLKAKASCKTTHFLLICKISPPMLKKLSNNHYDFKFFHGES